MNILELDSFNLADAVKFNDQLNPRIWQGQKMRPEVREKLLEIAEDFREFLGVDNLDVKDITLSGSNASYHYTPYSDIDLHLVVDVPKLNNNEVFRELFDAKKYQYNDLHNIKIGGYDVELYVEDADKSPVSQGIFSVLNNDWINIPRQRRATVDDTSVKSKYEDIKHRIESALKDKDFERIDKLAKKIKAYRQAGLDAHGEFGPENIAFKMLRNQGYIGKLYDARNAARDAELSLVERKKKKKKVKYGFAGTWGPMYDSSGSGEGGEGGVAEDATATPDGVNPTTQMFLNEKETPAPEEIIRDFLNFAVEKLNIDHVPKLRLKKDPAWSTRNHSFGRYDNATGELIVALGNRHIMDVLRTLAHELTHRKQDERESMPPDAGETGSAYENEANAQAGVLMRDYAAMHPEYFEDAPVNESASGYIPKNKKEAKMPQYATALSVDIKPGETGRQANKMALKTDAQGKPGLLIKSANMIGEAANSKSYGYNSTPLSQVPGEQEDDLGNQEATGPESPPQFPAGTTKIDVSDLTDWYRLGMDISDLDDADPEDYNQGPPQTVVVFPSDEAEQGYLKQFKRLGLKTHDLDPDVEGGEDVTGKHLHNALAEELEAFKNQDLFEINMSTGSLRREAAKTGAIAGMEFEMIVPNVEGGDDDGQMEADYSFDEGITSIQEAYDFFYDGDYNSRGDVTRLRDRMTNEYHEWLGEAFDTRWEGDEIEFVYNYIKENASADEIAEILGTEPNEAGEYPDPDKQAYRDAAEKIVEEGYGNYWYDAARDAEQEDFNNNADLESEWLEDRDLNTMQDIENEYGMSWPHWEQQGGGEASIEDVANEFQDAIGRDVRSSGNYHSGGVKRPSPTAQHYLVEPDGSLEADDSNDVGLEFVSPPLPIDDILSDLNKVKAWAKQYGCYTNDSTGLHINISVPDYSRENLDFVKLALLLGDEYVLDLFGRAGNTYAKSAMKLVKEKVRSNPEDAAQLLDKMKGNLDSLATKAIHSGVTNKYTSINTKDGHIEFRSPGGDWLDQNFDQIENTLLRFTVAMSAALNPDAYRQEYQKKLYKLLTADQKDSDTIRYFSDYVAGKIPKAALRSFVKQAQLERKLKKDPTGGEKYWWSVSRPGYGASAEVVATSREEAIAKGRAEYPDWATAKDITAKPLRPYEQSQQTFVWKVVGSSSSPYQSQGIEVVASTEFEAMQKARKEWNLNLGGRTEEEFFSTNGWSAVPVREAQPDAPGNWGIWINALDRFANEPGSYARGETPTSMRFPSQAAAEQWIEQQRAERPNLRNDIEVREIEPASQSDTDTSQTGQWKIIDGLGREVYRFRPAVNTRAKANELAAVWAREYNWDGNYQVEPAEEPQSMDTGVNTLRPTGPGPWEVANRDNNQVYFNPPSTHRQNAESEARTWLSQNGHNPNDFVVRTRQMGQDSSQSDIIDIEPDISPYVAPGSTTDPAQQRAQGGFTGEWKVLLPSGEEVYRFSGVGNSQSDANRIAAFWLRQNGYGVSGEGFEVVPVMGNS